MRWTWSTGATTPATATVVVAAADSSHDGGVNGQNALSDRYVGKSAAVHRDPTARRVIPRHHLGPYAHQRVFSVISKQTRVVVVSELFKKQKKRKETVNNMGPEGGEK